MRMCKLEWPSLIYRQTWRTLVCIKMLCMQREVNKHVHILPRVDITNNQRCFKGWKDQSVYTKQESV